MVVTQSVLTISFFAAIVSLSVSIGYILKTDQANAALLVVKNDLVTQTAATNALLLNLISASANITNSSSPSGPNMLIETPFQTGTVIWTNTYFAKTPCISTTLTQGYETSLLTLGSVSWMRLNILAGTGSIGLCSMANYPESFLAGYFSPPIESTLPIAFPSLSRLSALAGDGFSLQCDDGQGGGEKKRTIVDCPRVERVFIEANNIVIEAPATIPPGYNYDFATLITTGPSEYISQPYVNQ